MNDQQGTTNTEGQAGSKRSFTGLSFSRKPRRSVMLIDRWAEGIITLSGIGGIAAVSLVGLFLLWVVLPLLLPVGFQQEDDPARATGRAAGDAPILLQGIDGYGSLAWSLLGAGGIVLQDLQTGEVLDHQALPAAADLRSWSMVGNQRTAFGLADGSILLARVGFKSEFLDPGRVPAEIRDLPGGSTRPLGRGLVTVTPERQYRHESLDFTSDPLLQPSPAPILLVDLVDTPSGTVVAALDSLGGLHHLQLTFKTNMLTGEVRASTRTHTASLADLRLKTHSPPAQLKLSDTGGQIFLIHRDGSLELVEIGDDGLEVVTVQDLVEAPGATVTATGFLAGHASLAVGDSEGGLTVWFPVLGEAGSATKLVPAHRLQPGSAAVTALGGSTRSRMLTAGFADGTVRVYQVTADRVLGEDVLPGGAVRTVTMAPREDRILVSGAEGAGLWSLDAPYAEVSLKTLLRPVWYEGYDAPAFVWQSSAASDSFEPKMSLVPLIFGTLKATFYSLLFGLPLAVLAAIYTSEFLPKPTRARIKPVIEIMASLPSVVLGFLAALVMAPVVEKSAMPIIAVLVLAPVAVLTGAQLWQFLPRHLAARLDPWRPAAVTAAMALGATAAWNAAPWLERIAFAGDFKLWLDGQIGSGVAGWVVMLMVPAGMFTAWLNVMHGDRMIRNLNPAWSLQRVALVDFARFAAAAAAAFLIALFLGWLLNSAGWDPRGSVLGTYVQRNALIVGIAMGFAVIPLIYSISEDALVSVPDHLRAASLGAGATPWQTALLVVIPPAMSGLFSAAMIGVGRAVGETMIVLMAAGNTPIMDMNIFSGFRTLSANLAVELPEAVQNSTHYRTLFLAALTLFAMTFLLNTLAEGVRLHFRKKTSQL